MNKCAISAIIKKQKVELNRNGVIEMKENEIDQNDQSYHQESSSDLATSTGDSNPPDIVDNYERQNFNEVQKESGSNGFNGTIENNDDEVSKFF